MPNISLDHLEKELKRATTRRASLVGFVKRTVGRRFSSGASVSTKPPLTKSTSSRTYEDESSCSTSEDVEDGTTKRVRFLKSPQFDNAPVSHEISASKQLVKLYEKGNVSKVFYNREELMQFHEKANETIRKFDKEEDAVDNCEDPTLPQNVLQASLDACRAHVAVLEASLSSKGKNMNDTADIATTMPFVLTPEQATRFQSIYASSKKTLLGLEHNYSPFLEQERAQNQVNLDHLVTTLQDMARELGIYEKHVDKWQTILAHECTKHSHASTIFAHAQAQALARACRQEEQEDAAKELKNKKKSLKKEKSERKLKKEESKRKVSRTTSSSSKTRSQSRSRASGRSESRSRRTRSESRTRSSKSKKNSNSNKD